MPVALITGGSRGIGAATALRLAEDGFDVCLSYRGNARAAQDIADRIEQLGRHALPVCADLSDETDIVGLFNQCDGQLGAVQTLVNNAGVLEQQRRVAELTADRIDRIFRVNVFGTLLCCREAIRRMSTQHGGQGGNIVNVSSVAARLGAPNEYVDYAASKGAIDTLTVGLAKEVGNEGIRVNAVRPAYIHTDIHASGGEPDRVNRIAPTVPLGRGGDPREVANAIAWLVSPEASYTSGATIDVAGGI